MSYVILAYSFAAVMLGGLLVISLLQLHRR
jgi:hypothetical protein